MRRINEPRSKIHERWKCKNAECGKLVIISDDNFIADITEILNLLADNPDAIRTPVDNNAINLDSCRIENEIRRLFDSRQLDKDIIRQKLLEEAAVNYRTLSSKQYEAQRLKDIFRSQKRSPSIVSPKRKRETTANAPNTMSKTTILLSSTE